MATNFGQAFDAVKTALTTAGDTDADAHAALALIAAEDHFAGVVPDSPRPAEFFADLFATIRDVQAAQAANQP
jgi:hypothetical protein